MKAIEYNRSGFNFSEYDIKCFEKGSNVLNILRNNFESNGITYRIHNFDVIVLNKKGDKYRIIINYGFNQWMIIQVNWFNYMLFSWIQKRCWVQQRSRIEYAIGIVIAIAAIVLPLIFDKCD